MEMRQMSGASEGRLCVRLRYVPAGIHVHVEPLAGLIKR